MDLRFVTANPLPPLRLLDPPLSRTAGVQTALVTETLRFSEGLLRSPDGRLTQGRGSLSLSRVARRRCLRLSRTRGTSRATSGTAATYVVASMRLTEDFDLKSAFVIDWITIWTHFAYAATSDCVVLALGGSSSFADFVVVVAVVVVADVVDVDALVLAPPCAVDDVTRGQGAADDGCLRQSLRVLPLRMRSRSGAQRHSVPTAGRIQHSCCRAQGE